MLRERAGDPEAAHERDSRWSRRKAEFTRGQVTVAFEALRAEGWLSSLLVEARAVPLRHARRATRSVLPRFHPIETRIPREGVSAR